MIIFMVSPSLKKEFIEIIYQEYGVELSPEEGERIANSLVSYFDLLAKIFHRIKEEDGEAEIPNLPL